MSLWKTPPKEITQGIKILVYGKKGTGKTQFALSFPNLYINDAETGTGFYIKDENYQKNVRKVGSSQNYKDILAFFKSLKKELPIGSTLVIDSGTKVYEGLEQVQLELSEKKAKREGKSADDTNISIRGRGKIKSSWVFMQNIMIDASSLGKNTIMIAQGKDIMEQRAGQNVKTGETFAIHKDSGGDYDLILRFYTQKDGNDVRYYAEVEKDRTKTYKKGSIIENPSYELWKDFVITGEKEGDAEERIESNFEEDIVKTKEFIKEQEIDKPAELRKRLQILIESLKKSPTKIAELTSDIKTYQTEYKITDLNGDFNAEQVENFKKIVDELEKKYK